jgi:integrase
MGMRKMEVGSLAVSQILGEQGRVFIDLSAYDTKTGLPRTIPVPRNIEDEVLFYKNNSKKYLFESSRNEAKHIPPQTIDRAWRVAKKRAEIKTHYRFHDTRHTRATDMAKEGINPILAVTYLGMSLKTYQQNYLKLKKEDLLLISDSADTMITKGSST